MITLTADAGSTPDSPTRSSGEARILLVEDSPLLQVRLAELLERPGLHRVCQVVDCARDAQAAIDAGDFEVLVVDLQLRQGTGLEVITHARRRYAEGRQPLIIVLTNFGIPIVEARCRKAGADHFLDKIRHFERILSLIQDWRGTRT